MFGARVNFTKNIVQFFTNENTILKNIEYEKIITNQFSKYDRTSIGFDESTMYFFPKKIFVKNGKKYIPTVTFNSAAPMSRKEEITTFTTYQDCEI
jgi:hypothetical protein